MIGRDRDFSFNRLQGYCLCPTELVAEEVVLRQSEKYRIVTLSDNCSKGPTDNDNNCYAVKKVYEMELQEFIEWISSEEKTREKIITIERSL